MTGAAWPVGEARLERHYRRLLLAYPRRFRRRHGAEMVTTLVEMAEPGQTRPAARDVWHLCVSGVRQRFRLPAGRPLAWVGAVLVAVILGGFGAFVGSRAAGLSFPDLPDDARVAALTELAVPGGSGFSLDRSDSAWKGAVPNVSGVVDVPAWTPELSRDRLAADGWRVTPVYEVPGAWSGADGVQTPLRGFAFDGVRDGLHVRVGGYASPGSATVSVVLSPVDTGAVLPAVIAGGVLGFLAGWLIAAAGAHRIRRLPVVRRWAAVVVSGLAMATLVVPASALYILAARDVSLSGGVVRVLHDAVNAGPYWSVVTPWTLVQLTVVGFGLSVAAWAVMGGRHRSEVVVGQTPTPG
ncbi:hypothetical protein [Actinoplanes sp. CA-252034]|uniref:hypothetical protein n=1 Tax=Actinoplanes sp. CA-252034 TaxID=3239906 RepID=UPI003D99279D